MAEYIHYPQSLQPGERTEEERHCLRIAGDEIRRRNSRKLKVGALLATTVLSAGTLLHVDKSISRFIENAGKPADKLGTDISTSFAPTTRSITAKDGSNVRYNPVVADTVEGGRNKCETINDTLELHEVPTHTSVGDANGPWTGISIGDLPESIQNACDKDKDGVVWIADSNITK